MKTAYFILGMHRSGTSALGGTLNLMGLEFGSELTKPSEKENPKGFFENIFVQALNKKIFFENNSSWDDYTFDIENIEKKEIDKYIKEAKNILKNEFQYVNDFAIKDPRICLLFPIWEQACLDMEIDIKIIIPYRNPLEVAASLKKRNNFSYEFTFILWMKHFLLSENYSRKYNRIFISFDDLIYKTSMTLDEMSKFLGIDLVSKIQENIDEFLDKNIKHNNIPIKNFSKDSTLLLQDIFKLIEIKKFNDENKFDSMRKDFHHQLNLFNNKELIDSIREFKNNKIIMLESIDRLEKEQINLNTKFKNVEKLAQDRKEKIEKLQEEQISLNTKFKNAEKLAQDRKEKIEKLQEEQINLNTKFKNAEKLAQDRKEKIEKLQEEQINLNTKFKNAEKLAQDRKEKIEQLEDEKRGLNEKFKHAEFIARKRKEDIEKIQIEKNNLSLKLQEQQNEIKQLSKQNNEILNDFIEIKENRNLRFIKNIKGIY